MDDVAVSGSGILGPLLTLILKSTLVMGSPGPATMSAAAAGAAFGFRRSLSYVVGLMLGTTLVLLIVATGVFAVLLSVPMLGSALTALSAAYILYLAYRIATAPPLRAPDEMAQYPSFPAGLFLAMANPKAYVAIAAVYAGAVFTMTSPAAEQLLKLIVLGVMIVVIHLAWLLAGSCLSGVFRNPGSARIINWSFAAVLAVTAVLPLL
ncbi:LysE family translocator [Rhizobium binxianense]